jgi:hypothetical protein
MEHTLDVSAFGGLDVHLFIINPNSVTLDLDGYPVGVSFKA